MISAREEESTKILMQSYVYHGQKCFFVSTIDRASSCESGGRFSETMAWEYDVKAKKSLAIVAEDSCVSVSISKHFKVCEKLFEVGVYS